MIKSLPNLLCDKLQTLGLLSLLRHCFLTLEPFLQLFSLFLLTYHHRSTLVWILPVLYANIKSSPYFYLWLPYLYLQTLQSFSSVTCLLELFAYYDLWNFSSAKAKSSEDMRMESPSLETFKGCLDVVLGNCLRVALLAQEVGQDDLQRSHPTSTILWFYDKNVKMLRTHTVYTA